MASDGTRIAAQSHLQGASEVCGRILQHTAQQAAQVLQALEQAKASSSAHAWVASAAVHEMIQGFKAYLFAAHVAQRMLQEDSHVAAATAKQSLVTLPEALAYERWMQLNWRQQSDMSEGHTILAGLHQVRKALNREAGEVRRLHSGAQVALCTLSVHIRLDPSCEAGLACETRLHTHVFKPGSTIALSGEDLAAVGLTLWLLMQRVWRAFPLFLAIEPAPAAAPTGAQDQL